MKLRLFDAGFIGLFRDVILMP